MPEPDDGSEVIVYLDPEYDDDDPEQEIRFRRDDTANRDYVPGMSPLTAYDIDSARWVDQEGIWDHPLAWNGLPAIPGFRRVEPA
jgi:hypothetical protein